MSNTKEGWLHSEGKLNQWSKKYCILQSNLLLVFDKEPNSSSRGSPKSTYNLTDAVIRPAEGLHKFGFQIQMTKNSKKKNKSLGRFIFSRVELLDRTN